MFHGRGLYFIQYGVGGHEWECWQKQVTETAAVDMGGILPTGAGMNVMPTQSMIIQQNPQLTQALSQPISQGTFHPASPTLSWLLPVSSHDCHFPCLFPLLFFCWVIPFISPSCALKPLSLVCISFWIYKFQFVFHFLLTLLLSVL